MALAPFFSRTYSAVGEHLGVTRRQLESIMDDLVVGVRVGSDCRTPGNNQWTAELLVNLLSRFYPILDLSGDDDVCQSLSDLALEINPRIEITSKPETPSLTVCIGKASTIGNSFHAFTRGWVASLSKDSPSPVKAKDNPYAAGATAALAASHIFQSIFTQESNKASSDPDMSLSLLDYGSSVGSRSALPPVDLGEVAIAGLGAVGNPAIWAFARHPDLRGNLHLIDPEDIELSNLQRYCLPRLSDSKMSKVTLAAREIESTELGYTLWPCTIEDFAKQYEKIGILSTVCVSVDNIDGRRTAQALLPKLVINGWTSDNGLGVSWHRLLDSHACLACLYHPSQPILSQTEIAAQALGLPHEKVAMLYVAETGLSKEETAIVEAHLDIKKGALKNWIGKRVQDVFTSVVCGQVGVDLPGLNKIATVPLAHQSVLAGLLMAVELVKRSVPSLESKSQKAPLVVWDDVLRPPPKHWTAMRTKNPNCFCGDEIYTAAYRKKWGA